LRLDPEETMNVAIVGSGQTMHKSRRLDVSAPELIDEAVQAALLDARMEPDAIVVGNMEHFEGIHLSDLWPAEEAGLYGKPGFKVATGGTTGSSLATAVYYTVASGLYDRVLAVGWEKLSDSAGETTTGIVTAFDPIYERPTLAGAVSGLAVMAEYYRQTREIAPSQAALSAVSARRNAMRNPHAHLRKPVTVEEVLASPMLSTPIRLLDMCPTSDGACAVLFVSEDAARAAAKPPAWIAGVASAHNHTYLGDLCEGTPVYLNSLLAASREAYRQAAIVRPRAEIDVVEMYAPCSWSELEWSEVLGFCEPGEGGKFFESGVPMFEGEIPFSPSGGVISTNPIGATGLIRVAEVALQVTGRAGERQVEARTGMATGFGGSFWSEVMILRREK